MQVGLFALFGLFGSIGWLVALFFAARLQVARQWVEFYRERSEAPRVSERVAGHADVTALAIFGSLRTGLWEKGEWRDSIEEVEAAWWDLDEWERDDYREAAREVFRVSDALLNAGEPGEPGESEEAGESEEGDAG